MFTVAYCGYFDPDAPAGERICPAQVEGDSYPDARYAADVLGWYLGAEMGIDPDFCPDHKPETKES